MIGNEPPVYLFGDLRVIGRTGINRFNFDVGLDKNFAVKCLETSIDDFTRGRLQEMAREALLAVKYDHHDPLTFYDKSLLVTGFYLGRDGRWLCAERNRVDHLKESKDKYLDYSSHNADSTSDRNALMTLFTWWVDSANTVIDMKKNGK